MDCRRAGPAIWSMLAACLIAVVPPPAAAQATSLEMFERRRMLTAEEHRAWRAVGRVNIATFRERGMCTGTLIGQDLVLTAAHCVVSDRTGETYAPGNVHFVAGYRQGTSIAFRKAKDIIVHPEYRSGTTVDLERIGADIALIRLASPIPSSEAPSFRVAPAPLGRGALTLVSYRRDRAHALTRQLGCDVRGARDAVLALGCDVTFGASGSPLFAEIGGESRLVAVISAMSGTRARPIAWAVRVDAAIGGVLAAFD